MDGGGCLPPRRPPRTIARICPLVVEARPPALEFKCEVLWCRKRSLRNLRARAVSGICLRAPGTPGNSEWESHVSPRAVEPGESRRPRLLVLLRLPRLCPRHTRLTTLDSGVEQHGRDASPRGRRSPWCKTGFVCPDRLSPSPGTAVLLK